MINLSDHPLPFTSTTAIRDGDRCEIHTYDIPLMAVYADGSKRRITLHRPPEHIIHLGKGKSTVGNLHIHAYEMLLRSTIKNAVRDARKAGATAVYWVDRAAKKGLPVAWPD